MISEPATDAIDNTPLVALDRITGKYSGRIFAKLEMLNQGLSRKDRVPRRIIENAVADGNLTSWQTVVELSSLDCSQTDHCAVHGPDSLIVGTPSRVIEKDRICGASLDQIRDRHSGAKYCMAPALVCGSSRVLRCWYARTQTDPTDWRD